MFSGGMAPLNLSLALGGMSNPLQDPAFAAVGKTPSASTEMETIVNNKYINRLLEDTFSLVHSMSTRLLFSPFSRSARFICQTFYTALRKITQHGLLLIVIIIQVVRKGNIDCKLQFYSQSTFKTLVYSFKIIPYNDINICCLFECSPYLNIPRVCITFF